jgi:hypothetical protein
MAKFIFKKCLTKSFVMRNHNVTMCMIECYEKYSSNDHTNKKCNYFRKNKNWSLLVELVK